MYGHFLWAVKKNAPKFLPTQKGASAPGFSPVLRRLLFSSALQPSKAHLLIVLVLAVRSAFLGAVLALVLLSIFRIILVGLFLCVIVLGHNALLFSPLLFSMKIKMQQIIFVAQERLSILAGAEGVLDIEERMLDVKRRYGFYPQEKWDAHIGLRRYFEEKMGRDVYEVCEKETYDPKKC